MSTSPMKKPRLLLIGVILVVAVIGFVITLNNSKPGSFVYNTLKRSDNEWTLEEAKAKGQTKLDFRKGQAGEFKILPFKFEYGLDQGYEVYFKNEGPNEVKLTFQEVDWLAKKDKENLQVESYLIPPGEELKVELFNKTGDEDAEFWIVISDPTEPRPMIYGEFYISQ